MIRDVSAGSWRSGELDLSGPEMIENPGKLNTPGEIQCQSELFYPKNNNSKNKGWSGKRKAHELKNSLSEKAVKTRE